MYIVPIILRTIRTADAFHLVQCWMLLERNGTYCMEVDSLEEATAFASENGLHLTAPPCVDGELIFLPVDPATKGLNLFYTWADTSNTVLQDLWRPFMWVYGNTDVMGTNTYLSDISLAPGQSVYSVLTTYFKARPLTIVDEFQPQQTQDSS